ncbi:MAG: DUF3299 domain-containing protein [Gammaproteobacteria bacterium]|nr:DUF3299 domain-containing protein [Gammaproteobacteria bacterium]
MNTWRIVPALLLALFLAACGDQSSTGEPPTVSQTPPTDTNIAGGSEKVPADERPDFSVSPTPAEDRPERITESGDPREIEWDDLIPADFQPAKLLGDINLDELSDDDPRAQEVMAKLKALWDQAPVREDMDGREVKLPGFIVPVEADERETTAFLLVPYYGACVHVPPPPANQTVYVLTEAGKGASPELFDVVWVIGTMSVKRIANDIAEAGYTLYASAIEPYE